MDFSVDTLHTKENEMKNEFKTIFKTANVTSSAALSQTVLAKLNKALLATFVKSLVTLVEENMNMCRNAAVTLDQLKSEIIENQGKLF